MNKEEILELLRAISVQIDEAKVSDFELDERVSQIESLMTVVEDTKAEIKTLSEKLTDDRNYEIPLLVEESVKFNLEDRLAAREKEYQDNLEGIKNYQRLIENAERSIAAHEALIAISERKYSEELELRGPELRDSLGLTPEEFETLRSSLEEKRLRIESYKENLSNIREDLTEFQEKLSELMSLTEGLSNGVEEARAQLEFYDKAINQRNGVDEVAKLNDKLKLRNAEERLAEYTRVEAILSYDHEKAIKEMLEGYEAGTISHEELVGKLTELKEALNERLVSQDIQETYNSEEYETNRNAEARLIVEIEELEAKLADPNNYSVSPFIVERNNRELRNLERNIETGEKQIASYNDEIENLQGDITVANELIEELELENAEIQRQIRKAGVNIDPEVEKMLLSRIASNKADIVYLENSKLEASRTLEHNGMELELLTSKQERYRILHEKMKATLERKNEIDVTAKRLDEIDLTKKKAALEALRKRGLVANVSLIENIETLIGAELVETKEAEVSTEQSVSPEEATPITDEAQVDPAEATVVEEEIIPENNTTEVDSDTLESIEAEFGMDPIGLGDTRGWKAKYSEVENEELAKKAKDRNFVGKLKGFFGGVLKVSGYVIALGTTLVLSGLHPIQTAKSIRNFMKRAQENPEKYKDATPESVEAEIVEDIKAQGAQEVVVEQDEPVVQTSELNQTQDEVTIDSPLSMSVPEVPVAEQTMESAEDEIVVNVNNGESFTVDVSEELSKVEGPEVAVETAEVAADDTLVTTEEAAEITSETVEDTASSTEATEETLEEETEMKSSRFEKLSPEQIRSILEQVEAELGYKVEQEEMEDLELQEGRRVR